MKKRILAVKLKCEEAKKKIDEILLDPKLILECNIPVDILLKVKKEIEKMIVTLDKNRFSPIYGRFITDIPYADEELICYLIEVSVFYKRHT